MTGVLVIDKPEGPTSFDVVAQVRRAASQRRVGHAGTLDPMATGVLVICLGESTKLVPYLMDADKEYLATALLGVTTDTDDAAPNAQVLHRAPEDALRRILPADVAAGLASLVGPIVQRPPRFSALKVDGERLYDLAYAQRERTAPAPEDDLEQHLTGKQRPVMVHQIAVESIDLPQVRFRVRCGKGTYIRALARDLGERLAVGAHLTALRRLRSGGFQIEDASPLALGPADGRPYFPAPPRLFLPARALVHLPQVSVPQDTARRLRHGLVPPFLSFEDQTGGLPSPVQGQLVAVLDPSANLVAVLAGVSDTKWSISRVFADPSGPVPGVARDEQG